MWTFQGNYAEIMPTNCWRLWVYNCSCSFKVPSRLDQGNHCQSSQGWWYTVTEFLLEDRQANQFSLRAIILTNCLVSLCFHSGSCSAWQGRAVTLPIPDTSLQTGKLNSSAWGYSTQQERAALSSTSPHSLIYTPVAIPVTSESESWIYGEIMLSCQCREKWL